MTETGPVTCRQVGRHDPIIFHVTSADCNARVQRQKIGRAGVPKPPHYVPKKCFRPESIGVQHRTQPPMPPFTCHQDVPPQFAHRAPWRAPSD